MKLNEVMIVYRKLEQARRFTELHNFPAKDKKLTAYDTESIYDEIQDIDNCYEEIGTDLYEDK